MKKLVALSGYCWVFTALALAVLCGISMYAIKQPDSQSAIWILGTIFTLLLIIVIWYMPMAITLDEDSLRVERPLRIKTIPLSEIENIKMCPPSMGEKTICGSYGFMGHYGWFSERPRQILCILRQVVRLLPGNFERRQKVYAWVPGCSGSCGHCQTHAWQKIKLF